MINKNKIVIIGGAGFVGSNIADYFIKQKFNVTVIDKKKPNFLNEKIKFVNLDISNSLKVVGEIKKNDIVFYLADIADINEAKKNPMLTIRQNVLNLTSILHHLRNCNIRRFIYGSSLYVYSTAGSIYRATKQSAEILVETLSELYGLKYTFIRFGSLYGKRAQSWNGLNKFISQIISKKKVVYSGTGKELREYINISDAAKMSDEVALDKKFENKAVTIAAQQSISVDHLFSLIFEIYGTKKKVKYLNRNNLDDHYGLTPYRYQPKPSTKLISNSMKDLGEGILDIIDDMTLSK
jgi:UDP-glucose 4-epimerase